MVNRKSFEQRHVQCIRAVASILFAICIVGPLNGQNVIEPGDNWRVDKKLLPKNFRFIYNSDGDNMFLFQANTPETLYPYVDEVAETGVTSFFVCPNVGMTMNFPTKVGDMAGQHISGEKLAAMTGWGKQIIHNLRSFTAAGHDPLGLAVERAREKKMEVFMTFRLNEVHSVEQEDSYHFSTFWKEHPEWRIGKNGDPLPQIYLDILGPRTHPIVAGWLPAGLNFAIPEVRAQRLAELRELCERYNIDGLELDFQRFPMFFKPGEEARNIEVMTQWMRDVRAMTRETGEKRGRPILLTARIMATPEQNLAIGLEPMKWVNKKIVDFITVSHYLHNNFPLPISQYRKLLPKGFPLYASIEYEPDFDSYRKVADQLWQMGVDGVSLFNFFAPRENGKQPPFDRIHEVGYPPTLKAEKVSGTVRSAKEPTLLVANKHSNTLSFVNPKTLKVIETIPTGPNPHEITVTPDQRFAYLSSYAPPGNTISVVDLVARKMIKQIPTGQYTRIHGASMSPDGKHAYFTAGQTGYVVEVDTKTNEVTRGIPTHGKISHTVYVSPDGKRLYTGNIVSENVSVIDRVSGELITQIKAGKGVEGMAFTPDGKHIWALNQTGGTITIIDMATHEPIETFNCPGMPVRIRFTDNGKLALVPSWTKEGEMIVIDVATRKEIKRIKVGSFAIGVELSPDGKRAFVGCEDSMEAEVLPDGSERVRLNTGDSDGLHVINMKTLTVESVIKTGLGPDPMVMWYPAKAVSVKK